MQYELAREIMATEIERKFLVKGEFKHLSTGSTVITQGYLSSVPERTVRVRIKGKKAFLTIKGIGSNSGASRYEFEMDIPLTDGRELLKISERGIIEKKRFLVPFGNHTFEVDEFYGENLGLVLAEVELASEDEAYQKPPWLGKEVTGDERYYNTRLAKNPYGKWKRG